MIDIAFAVSIGLPPPTARMKSAFERLSSKRAFLTSFTVGSGVTSEKMTDGILFFIKREIIFCARPHSIKPLSVIMKAFLK